MAATNLNSSSTNVALNLFAKVVVALFAQKAIDGAAPTLFAATAPMPAAGYAGPSKRGGFAGPPVLVDRSADASDAGVAARLWAASEDLTGTSFPL